MPTSQARPDSIPPDAVSVQSIVDAIYDVISGPAGVAPDWDRFRALFSPGARLIPTNREAGGERVIRVHDVEEYILVTGDYLKENAFYERQIASREERFGSIVHVWSTYESLHDPADEVPFVRGINSIQLRHDGRRWWVVTIFWDTERPGTPIPEQYLPSAPAAGG